jgi:hypothetical protein
MNPLEQGIAQFGRWNWRIFALNMLLRPEDLPEDGWRILSEKGWRWGQVGPTFDRKRASPDSFKSEETERAKQARGFCAWRSFETKDRRGFWTQIAPFASAEDADAMIPKMQLPGKKNPRFDGSITDEQWTEDCPITGVSKVLVHEQSVTTPRGPSKTTYVYGSVDNYVIALALSGVNSDILLHELKVVAERQADKITAMRATRKM